MVGITLKHSILLSALIALGGMILPDDASAGELIRGIRVRNGYGYRSSGSMTTAQRSVWVPLNQRRPFVIESSYHGRNYFEYETATRNYYKTLKRYENGEPVQFQTATVRRGLSPVSNARAAQVQRVSYNRPAVSRGAYVQPKVVTTVSSKQVTRTPSINFNSSNGEALARVNQPTKRKELSLLSDPAMDTPPAERVESKESVWTHFRNALLGR